MGGVEYLWLMLPPSCYAMRWRSKRTFPSGQLLKEQDLLVGWVTITNLIWNGKQDSTDSQWSFALGLKKKERCLASVCVSVWTLRVRLCLLPVPPPLQVLFIQLDKTFYSIQKPPFVCVAVHCSICRRMSANRNKKQKNTPHHFWISDLMLNIVLFIFGLTHGNRTALTLSACLPYSWKWDSTESKCLLTLWKWDSIDSQCSFALQNWVLTLSAHLPYSQTWDSTDSQCSFALLTEIRQHWLSVFIHLPHGSAIATHSQNAGEFSMSQRKPAKLNRKQALWAQHTLLSSSSFFGRHHFACIQRQFRRYIQGEATTVVCLQTAPHRSYLHVLLRTHSHLDMLTVPDTPGLQCGGPLQTSVCPYLVHRPCALCMEQPLSWRWICWLHVHSKASSEWEVCSHHTHSATGHPPCWDRCMFSVREFWDSSPLVCGPFNGQSSEAGTECTKTLYTVPW